MATLSPKPRVAIVGAGVIGLSVGLCLTETFKDRLDVTIIANKFSPDTTSDRAGAVYILGSAVAGSDHDTKKYSPATFHFLKRLYDSNLRDEIGLRIIHMYSLYDEKFTGDLWFKDLLMNFKDLSREEAKELGLPYQQYQSIHSFDTYLVKGVKYLPWLMEKIRKDGGLIEKRNIANLAELSNYDIIINCTGLGARELVGDEGVIPVRGQIVAVKAPAMSQEAISYHTHWSGSNHHELTYFYPHKDVVLLGGTAEPLTWSTIPDPMTAQGIYDRCLQLAPGLKEAEVVGGWACLRPYRESVRLEVEDPSSSPVIIHNYGHGSQGVIMSWGSALETVKLVQECLEKKKKPLSKL